MSLQLGLIDLLVLVGYLLSIVAIGLWAGGAPRNLDAYLLGDRNLPWWAILGSIVATETSTATVLSVPGEAYGPAGMKFLQLTLGYVVGRSVIVYALLPLYFRGKLFTAYQVLDQRFGGATKQAASLLFLVTRNLGDGLRLFLAALVLNQLAGLPFTASVLVMGVATIIYTYFGGMRSVVWNDCVQLVIYMAGGIAALLVLIDQLPGGWPELREFGVATGKFQLFNWRWSLSDPYTFWAGLIGGAVLTIGTHGTDHMMVQRYLSARSQRDAGRALIASGFVVCAQFALFLLIGVGLAAFYAHQPAKVFSKDDVVFADFIISSFPRNTGLIGLMLAAILAAAMSTLSSSLNSSASAFVNDFYVGWCRETPSPDRLFHVTRRLTIVFGLVQVVIGVVAFGFENSVVRNALTIAGFSSGLLLGVFALGVITTHVDQFSALVAMAIGLTVLLAIQFATPLVNVRVAFPWIPLIGCTTTFLAGLAVARLKSIGRPGS